MRERIAIEINDCFFRAGVMHNIDILREYFDRDSVCNRASYLLSYHYDKQTSDYQKKVRRLYCVYLKCNPK